MRKVKKSSDADALLCNLIRLSNQKEDFLTEVFANLLQTDARLSRAFVKRLLPNRKSDAPVTIVTQHSLRAWKSRPDMLVTTGGLRIAVEHKLDAPEGSGQLSKYLTLPRRQVSRVALISADYRRLAPEILKHPRYVRPADGQSHFLWTDIWPLIQLACRLQVAGAHAARRLFSELGIQPAHRLVPNLNDPDPKRALQNDRALSKLWQPTRRALEQRGMECVSSIRTTRSSEVYVYPPDSSPIGVVWLNPFASPSTLLVRLRMADRKTRDLLLSRLESRRHLIPVGPLLSMVPGKRKAHSDRWAVDVRVPWHLLLASCKNRIAMSRALKRLVLRIIDAAARARARPN